MSVCAVCGAEIGREHRDGSLLLVAAAGHQSRAWAWPVCSDACDRALWALLDADFDAHLSEFFGQAPEARR